MIEEFSINSELADKVIAKKDFL